MCRYACPVAEAEASEAATPTWKGAQLRRRLENGAPLAGPVAEAAYACSDCGLAHEHCLHGHRPFDAYRAVRIEAYAAGVAPERARSFAARVRRLGNPFEEGLERRLARAAPAGALLAEGARAERVLFPGCTAMRHAPATIAEALLVVERVERAPVPVAASGAGCCGLPLLAVGDLEGFRGMASRLARALEGAGEVLALDPGCAHAMDALYPAAGVTPRVRARTLVERLGERLDAVRAAVVRPLEGEEAARLAYHDPCWLGRHRGVFEPPRALVAAASGRPPLEAPTCRERAWCSGAGLPYAKLRPAGAARIRERRLEEFREAGAARIVTACPSAARMLGKGLPAESAPLDVVSLLARAMAPG
jgi:Fe-S oxidoreductase